MAEHSWFWPTDFVGDGEPIPQAAGWPDIFASIFAPVSPGGCMGGMVPDQRGGSYNGRLLVSGGQVLNQIGFALIGGIFFNMDVAGSRFFWAEQFGDFATHTAYVRLKSQWASRQARIGSPGGPWYPGSVSAPPDSGGVIGSEFDLTWGSVDYTFGPGDPAPTVISSLSYYTSPVIHRYYLQNASHIMLKRQGGSATNWVTSGNTNYTQEHPCEVVTSVIKAAASGTSGTEVLNTLIYPRECIIVVTPFNVTSLSTLEFGLNYNGGAGQWEIVWTSSGAQQPDFMVMGIKAITLT